MKKLKAIVKMIGDIATITGFLVSFVLIVCKVFLDADISWGSVLGPFFICFFTALFFNMLIAIVVCEIVDWYKTRKNLRR